MLPSPPHDRATPGPATERRADAEPNALVAAAGRGELPGWAIASPSRREHMARVARLLDTWATELGLSEHDRVRWRAAAYLHDALRDARVDVLRERVSTELADLPGPVLHGPAAAQRLRDVGVRDEELLDAVAYHTVGHARLGTLGRALYAADFLDPGRDFLTEWRTELRARMPRELRAVVVEILRARIEELLERRGALLPPTVAFWNTLVAENG